MFAQKNLNIFTICPGCDKSVLVLRPENRHFDLLRPCGCFFLSRLLPYVTMASYEDAKHEYFNFLPFQTKFLNFEIISPLYCMSNSETKCTTKFDWASILKLTLRQKKKTYEYFSLKYAGVTKPITPAITLFH